MKLGALRSAICISPVLGPVWAPAPHVTARRSAAALFEELRCAHANSRVISSLRGAHRAWEDLIECYAACEARGKAEALVRARLSAGGRTPRLLCALGLITGEDAPYAPRA